LERILVDALVATLSPEAGSIVTRQVQAVNRVQRHANDKEVNLYRIRRGRPSREGLPLFPIALPEVKLATITYRIIGEANSSRVDFWIANGRLFSLGFQETPKKISAGEVEIRDVKLLVDPMAPATAADRRSLDRGALTGWIAEWSKQHETTSLTEPLPRPEREHRLQQLEAALPSDYLDLVSQTEGLQINGGRVYGLSEIREVVMEDATYYVLAEMEDRGVLAVRQGNSDAVIYFFAYGADGVDSGGSLREAVEKLLRGELS
jgi:hypothetical protein